MFALLNIYIMNLHDAINGSSQRAGTVMLLEQFVTIFRYTNIDTRIDNHPQTHTQKETHSQTHTHKDTDKHTNTQTHIHSRSYSTSQ